MLRLRRAGHVHLEPTAALTARSACRLLPRQREELNPTSSQHHRDIRKVIQDVRKFAAPELRQETRELDRGLWRIVSSPQ